MYVLQRQFIFPRHLVPHPGEPDMSILGAEAEWLDTGSGRVESWYLRAAGAAAGRPGPAIIFAHGNGELIDYWPGELKPLAAAGIGVLLVEFPGYGRSQGTPSQERILEVFTRAYDRLAARPEVDRGRIVLMGRSLGGGAVCDLSLQRPAAALVLLSTFTSIRSYAGRYLAPGFLIRDPFDNLAAVGRYDGPVLIVHGRFDPVAPFRHGEQLKAAARRGRLIAYDAGHNDCPPDWAVFRADLLNFLRAEGILPQ
ncbi:MAG TPA: alpha/beta hydrolase [Mycobacterium sp.]|nr:alpha/beta hydrolase [Mycobacterium sp.]